MRPRPASIPRCPSCESNDIYPLPGSGADGVSARRSRRGRTRAKYGCRACGRRFRKALEEDGEGKAGHSRPSPAPAFAHLSAKRCVCGELMAANGTRAAGAIKRWLCPGCRRTEETPGTPI